MKDKLPEELQMKSSTQIYEVFKSTINFQSEVAPQVDFICDLGQVVDQVDLRRDFRAVGKEEMLLDKKVQV